MNKTQAWKIYNNSPTPKYYWEDRNGQKGLLLSICPKCGEKQTRETYLGGFWIDAFTLIQDYEITSISKHNCGQWCQTYG